jgi:hypothetical protein
VAVQLITVADVRAVLQKPEGDTEQDQIISDLITRASEAIQNCTEREFKSADTPPTTRTFFYTGRGVLDLSPYDLRGTPAPTVKIDTTDGAGGTTLAATEYRLMPKPAKDGVYHWLRLNPLTSGSSSRFPEREVTITGTWGFAAVPEDVKHWCAVTVAEWLRKDVAAFSTTFNIDSQRFDVPTDLPASAKAGLKHYWTPPV